MCGGQNVKWLVLPRFGWTDIPSPAVVNEVLIVLKKTRQGDMFRSIMCGGKK